MQDSSTIGVFVMSGCNISGRIFKLSHIFLCLLIIWGVPSSTWVPLAIFFAKIIISIINYLIIDLSIFRSLVPPDSYIFKSGNWIFFIFVYCACFLCQGLVILEIPFFVALKTSNSAQFLRFAILILFISTCLTPFLWFHQLVNGELEAS